MREGREPLPPWLRGRMNRATLFAVLAALGAACATSRVVPQTAPELSATSRAVPPLPSRGMLVLGRDTLRSVASDLVVQRAAADAPPPRDDAVVLAALAREMFETGWNPAPEPAVTRIVTGHRVAVGLRDVLARGQATLLDAASMIAPASTADAVLVVRDWALGWAAAPVLAESGWAVCPLAADLAVSLHDRSMQLLWEGRVRVRTTDLSETRVTVARKRAWAVPPTSCVARGGCGGCSTPPSPDAEAALAEHAARVIADAVPH